jgi:hypothetical protein
MNKLRDYRAGTALLALPSWMGSAAIGGRRQSRGETGNEWVFSSSPAASAPAVARFDPDPARAPG